MPPSDISNSTLLFPLSRVRTPSLDNPPDHSAFREESLNRWPRKVVSHSLPRDPVSPCLKLHHPENRSPSAHHSSMPINRAGAKRTSSSSPCTAPCVHIPCIVSRLLSSAALWRCTRRRGTVLRILRCLCWWY